VHRGANEFAERRPLRHDQRRDCGGIVGIVLSPHRALPGYDNSDIARLVLLAMTAAGTAVITGVLRQKWVDAFAWERKHHATATRLSAALDQVDIGIVLLDSDTRAEFINRAFRDTFALPDEKADSKPPSLR